MNFHRKHPERPFCNSLFSGRHLHIKIYPSFTSVEDGKKLLMLYVSFLPAAGRSRFWREWYG